MRQRETTEETIEGKVAAEVERRLSPLIDQLCAKIDAMPAPVASAAAHEDEDRFVPKAETAALMHSHPSTLVRLEKRGILPPRRMLGGRTGWLMSEIRAALKAIPHAPKLRPASLAKAN